MPTVYLSPIGNSQQVDSSGVPRNLAKLYTYAAGSTTPRTTYTDSTGNTAQANPIILNSLGLPDNPIWLPTGQTKFVLKTPTDVTIWTEDNVNGINDVSLSVSEWQASGLTPTYISATSFSFAGDQTAAFMTGRRLLSTITAGTAYSTVVSSAFAVGITTVTVINDSTPLDSGLSAVSYGLLTATNPSIPATVMNDIGLCEFRMTLTSGLPVTTSDVTAATTVYVTPYQGNRISLYNGSTGWIIRSSAEMSIAVPATTSTMYDLFCYDNSGTPTLEATAWTNDSTRATALTLQNGVYVKSGATTRRYLGSFRTTTVSGQTEDSLAKRYVWNYYNRVVRRMEVLETTNSWTYSTDTWRQANGSATNQLDCVIGLAEVTVEATVQVGAQSNQAANNGNIMVGIGADTTSANTAQIHAISPNLVTNVYQAVTAFYKGNPAAGRHYFAWVERWDGGGITTWSGISGSATKFQSGIHGTFQG